MWFLPQARLCWVNWARRIFSSRGIQNWILLGIPFNVARPFEPILFDFDQYNIAQSEREKVVQVANFLKQNPNAHLLIEGYCDWKGTPAYNKSLGERRASNIKEFLIELGADQNRIDTLSIGDESAIPNATKDQARLDRRADFVITKDSI